MGNYPFLIAQTRNAIIINPSGDTTGAADTTAVNTVAQAGKAAQLGNGTYYVTNLLPDTNGAILGTGPGTMLQAVAGTTGAVIALKTPATTQQVLVADLTIIANTGTLIGISLDNTGFTPAIFDSRHELRNVYVYQAGGDSFKFGANIRGALVTGCQQYHGQGAGFNLAASTTDCLFTDCVSGQSVSHGFLLAGGNNMIKGCKAFFAGYNGSTWGTTQAGFYLNGCTYNTMAACSAQQNALHGFDLQSAVHCSVAGESDSNGAGGAANAAGVNTNGATYCTVTGVSGNNNGALTPAAQQWGIQVAGTQTGTIFNNCTVTGTSGGFNYVSGFGYTFLSQPNSDFSQASFLKIPAQVLSNDAPQALANASTILTGTDGNYGAIPVTATGAVIGLILEPPVNTWTKVTVVNQSAFALTFDVAGTSHVADGISDVIAALTARTFVYDGNTSLWYRSG